MDRSLMTITCKAGIVQAINLIATITLLISITILIMIYLYLGQPIL